MQNVCEMPTSASETNAPKTPCFSCLNWIKKCHRCSSREVTQNPDTAWPEMSQVLSRSQPHWQLCPCNGLRSQRPCFCALLAPEAIVAAGNTTWLPCFWHHIFWTLSNFATLCNSAMAALWANQRSHVAAFWANNVREDGEFATMTEFANIQH